MTISYQRPRRRLKNLAVGATAASLLASALMVPAQAAPAESAASSARSVEVSAQQTQGLPGQYQMAYSQKNDKLWVTGSSGRPPIETATIARVNPSTMKIEANAAMPTLRTGTGQNAGYQYNGAYGIAADDANNTVWVTNTRSSAVSVFDQTTLKQIWTSYDPAASEQVVDHPREVKIDDATGRAFVTDGKGVVAFDLTTHEAQRIDVGEGAGTGMNSFLDEEAGRLYTPDISRGVVSVIDTKTLKVVQTITVHADDSSAGLSPSDVTVDKSLNEIYVSSQGKGGKNSGVTVYDLTTGEYKKSIPFGTQALAIDNDEARDLVYVTDFGKGEVGVIDARTGKVVSSVDTGSRATNDVLVTPEGAFAVDKAGAYANQSVPFTLDFTSGTTRTSNTEQKGYGAQLSPINADTLYKIDTKVTETSPESEAPAEEQTVKASDGTATVTSVKTVREGAEVTVTGIGWKAQDGSGSNVSVKLDKGKTTIGGDAVVATVDANAQGEFSATFPFPGKDNANEAWTVGSSHTIHVLSGSGKTGDVARNAVLTVGVAAAPASADEASEVSQVSPQATAFQGYPAATKTTDKVLTDRDFKDVTDSTIFAKEIRSIANKGITEGWDDNTYRPWANIERGQMAAYIYRMAGSPSYTAPATPQFTDVSKDDPFYKEISWLHATGIAQGWSDGTFRPNAKVERGAMAAFFYRAAGSPQYRAGNPAFSDVQRGETFYKEIAWLQDSGITKGYDDGTFRPWTAIKRDQMAAFVDRFSGRYKVTVSAQ
ncbi:S-layer homology domain-containing protein [Rothia kristinae]|uniref:SLH domain-containing protein n=3 Tax=Rothia kristinae TaxID=37923 RepID=A0A199NUW9_9MICC|nr:S-layer homology domain-containing protein [Rothia kristinae]OAX52722.1 hypothetical protein AN277_0201885 [Rothia kristinae]